MKTHILIATLCAILSSGMARGAPVPVDTARWYDDVTGKYSRAMGGGGTPVLNAQDDNGQWQIIRDDWEQVGTKQIWRSRNGKEAVFCDSLGNYHVRRGTHHLGLHSVRLVKFNLNDSTYTILDNTPAPDSVTVAGGSVTCWGIFYGINLELRNNAKFFQESALRWEFTQAARDSLANLPGTWNNRLLATVHEIDHDSLNATLPGLSAAGVLTVDFIDVTDQGARVWALQKTTIETADSQTTIPVYKRIVLTGGNAFFVEGFRPTLTAAFPSGSLWHSATFGSTEVGTNYVSSDNVVNGGKASTGTTVGTTDSITVYMAVTTATHNVVTWLADGNEGAGNPNCLASATARSIGVTAAGWQGFVFSGYELTASTAYHLCMNANSAGGDAFYYKGAFTGTTRFFTDPATYSGSCVEGDAYTYTNSHKNPIYCTYTEASSWQGYRRQQLLKGSWFVRDTQKTFAGACDEISE